MITFSVNDRVVSKSTGNLGTVTYVSNRGDTVTDKFGTYVAKRGCVSVKYDSDPEREVHYLCTHVPRGIKLL